MKRSTRIIGLLMALIMIIGGTSSFATTIPAFWLDTYHYTTDSTTKDMWDSYMYTAQFADYYKTKADQARTVALQYEQYYDAALNATILTGIETAAHGLFSYVEPGNMINFLVSAYDLSSALENLNVVQAQALSAAQNLKMYTDLVIQYGDSAYAKKQAVWNYANKWGTVKWLP